MNHEIIRNESFYGVCITKINFVLGILQTISKYLNQKKYFITNCGKTAHYYHV